VPDLKALGEKPITTKTPRPPRNAKDKARDFLGVLGALVIDVKIVSFPSKGVHQ
jgi:hypothetical protein